MQSQDNNRKAVLITGASTGIGAATAWELDRRGFRVFAGVRNEEAAGRLREKASPNLTPLMLDVTDADQIASAVDTIEQAMSAAEGDRAILPSEKSGQSPSRGLAGLVNNAGIAVGGPLEILPLEAFRRQFEVNVIGLLAVTQAFLPLLRKGRGRIVNVSSVSGAMASPFMGPYAASKHAVEALSDSLRLELRHSGVAVSVVAPGPIDTPIWEKSSQEAESMEETIPPERVAPYEDDLAALRAMIRETAQSADPVETVVRAIVHALTAEKPKIRYYLRFRNRLMCRGFRVVPDGLRDWIIRRAIGLK